MNGLELFTAFHVLISLIFVVLGYAAGRGLLRAAPRAAIVRGSHR